MAKENVDASPLPSDIQGKLRQFKRVLMSYVDFQQAAGIAQVILGMEEYPAKQRFLYQGLNCGMIVAYCRPFSGNDRSVAANDRIPDLPSRLLRVLSAEEMEVHEVVMLDRNKVLAHSDSDVWQPDPHIFKYRGVEMLVPMFTAAHAPLTKETTQIVSGMAGKLMDACFAERLRLEPELKPHLRVVEVDDRLVQELAAEAGLRPPPTT